jgi:hypothetical protein
MKVPHLIVEKRFRNFHSGGEKREQRLSKPYGSMTIPDTMRMTVCTIVDGRTNIPRRLHEILGAPRAKHCHQPLCLLA